MPRASAAWRHPLRRMTLHERWLRVLDKIACTLGTDWIERQQKVASWVDETLVWGSSEHYRNSARPMDSWTLNSWKKQNQHPHPTLYWLMANVRRLFKRKEVVCKINYKNRWYKYSLIFVGFYTNSSTLIMSTNHVCNRFWKWSLNLNVIWWFVIIACWCDKTNTLSLL